MVREVGPIAENVLKKYLGTVREARQGRAAGRGAARDGALDEAAVERNLSTLPEDERRPALVDALNELLYAELLAVKRTLGAGPRDGARPGAASAAVSPDLRQQVRGAVLLLAALLLLVLWRLWPLL